MRLVKIAALALAVGAMPLSACQTAPLASTPQAQFTVKQVETSVEVAMNAAEALWLKHRAEIPAQYADQVSAIAHRIPTVRAALRNAEKLANAQDFAAQVAAGYSLAQDLTRAITAHSPSAAAEVAAQH